MAEKLYQNSEEENFSNYNYEDFVRIIKKDDVINSSKSYKLDEIDLNKENQKENLINSIQSSDMTSLSLSQTENLSQTSDNLYIPNDTKQNSVSGNKTEGKNEEKIIDYFLGYENYFRIIFPEKFNEYKTSRNYLPKKFKDIDKNVSNENNNNININNVTQNEYNNNQEENKVINSNNFQFGNNYYYYPMNGNIMYYLYNNFYINFANIHPPSQDETTDEKIEKEVHTVKKEEEIHKKIQDETEPKKDEKTESKDNSNEEGEYEHIYIIKRKNVRNNNNKKYNKQERQERPKEKRNNKDYNHYNYNNKNNYYYNNNDNYTKFNRNFDNRKKKYKYENNFYNKKYHKEIYY